ncbi:uncharacterized protein YnzC (UPF0291/DUF896 family) [Natronobacillus azotifigens]|uniref:Ig-like domain repeat protein n=1 Tax=Natronobacillus azotifigens TaxID=472978 RepID=A0A9J6RBV8_9BACI|nr:fibronectin type III domain-containing protein [Natronobacillus azotifigens]MCZ0703021.1 Ig-like domain repeat protein [Natronobacillus azotifigens]
MIIKKKIKTLFSKSLTIGLILLLLCQLFLVPVTKASEVGDGTPPTVNDITVSKDQLTVGDQLEIEAKVEDDHSGVKEVTVFYDPPSKNRIVFIRLTYNNETDRWEGQHEVSEFDEAGTWTFRAIRVIDQAGNDIQYRPSDLNLAESLDFNVDNPDGDDTPPTVENIVVNKDQLTVGDQLEIEANVEDDHSGVKEVTVFYDPPSKNRIVSIRLTYNNETDRWKGQHEVSEFDEAGTWTFRAIRVIDHAGNDIQYRPSDLTLVENLDFNVDNPDGDGTPPTVENIVVNKDQLTVGDQLEIEAKVEDDHSGVKEVTVFYDPPSKNRIVLIRLTYNNETDRWEGDHRVSEFDEAGTWTFRAIRVIDHAGNDIQYRPSDLNLAESLDFTVIPPVDLGLDPLSQTYINTNQTWTEEMVEGDLYVGPNSTLTINGDVDIDGDVYVFGAIRNYGNLKINGTLYARRVNYGIGGTSNGTVLMLGGTNQIANIMVSNTPWEIPIEFYNDDFIVVENKLQVSGATLPFIDLYINGDKVSFGKDGTFKVELSDITDGVISYETKDIFGHKQSYDLEVDLYNGPEWENGQKLLADSVGEDYVDLAWQEADDAFGIEAYYLYQDDHLIYTGDENNFTYRVNDLTPATAYQFSLQAKSKKGHLSKPLKIDVITELTQEMIIAGLIKETEMLIEELPSEEVFGLMDEEQLEIARNKVDQLVEMGLEKGSITNLDKLEGLEARLIELKHLIEDAENNIGQLPSLDDLNLADEELVIKARKHVKTAQDLGALPSDIKNIGDLIALEVKIASLKEDKEMAEHSIEIAILAIKNLPSVEDINLDHRAYVEEARALVEVALSLNVAQEDITNLTDLEALESKLTELLLHQQLLEDTVDDVNCAIETLPPLEKIRPSDEDAFNKVMTKIEQAFELGITEEDIVQLNIIKAIEERLQVFKDISLTDSEQAIKLSPDVEGDTAYIDDIAFELLKTNQQFIIDLSDQQVTKVHLTSEQILMLIERRSNIQIENEAVTMYLPSGNLAGKEIVFELTETKTPIKADQALSSVYQFRIIEGDQLLSEFKEPVTLTFTVDSFNGSADGLNVYYYNEADNAWMQIGGHYTNGKVSASVDHFSIFAVFDDSVMAADPDPVEQKKDQNHVQEDTDRSDNSIEESESNDSPSYSELEEQTSIAETNKDHELPVTASFLFNWIFSGALLTVFGILHLVIKKKSTTI